MHDNINVNVGGPINADYPKVYKTKFLKPGIPFSLQVTEPDTKYVIKHDFVLDGDVTIPANCVLEFDGGSLTTSYGILLSDNCSISNGKIVFETGSTGLQIVNKNNIKISCTYIKKTSTTDSGMYYAGLVSVFCNGSTNVTIKDCKFELEDIAQGISFIDCTDCEVNNCNIDNPNSYNPATITTFNTFGILVLDETTNVKIVNNTISNVGIGVYAISNEGANLKNAINIIICGNIIHDCGTYGACAYNVDGSFAEKMIISHNIIYAIYGSYGTAEQLRQGTGIYLQTCANICVLGNYIEDVCKLTNEFDYLAPAGIGVNTSDYIAVSGNTVKKSGAHGIVARGDNCSYIGNVIDNVEKHGIFMTGGNNVTISNNSVDNFSITGIYKPVDNTGVTHQNISVVGNALYENNSSVAGISMNSCDNLNISNNSIVAGNGNASCIDVSSSCSNTTISSNQIKFSEGRGIVSVGSNVNITCNGVNGSSQYANIDTNTDATISNNIVSNPNNYDTEMKFQYTAAEVIELRSKSSIQFIEVTTAGTLKGVKNLPPNGTLYMKVPSGTTITDLGSTSVECILFRQLGTTKTYSEVTYVCFHRNGNEGYAWCVQG